MSIFSSPKLKSKFKWGKVIDIPIKIESFEFGDEFQIGSLQISCDPFVDFAVDFRTEMILPSSSFTFGIL